MSLIPNEVPSAGERPTLQLNGQAWGVAFGVVGGIGLFIATIALVIKGGDRVGYHLNSLSAFLPGYEVTFGGAIVGAIYLFLIGYAIGRLIGIVYNFVARPRG